jgi:peptide chain release factor 2
MYDLTQKVKELYEEFLQVKVRMNVDEKGKLASELEEKSSVQNFWDDQENARRVMQELGDIRKELEEVSALESDLAMLHDLAGEGVLTENFAKDISEVEDRFKKFKLTTFLSGNHDKKTALVSIHSGQGGTEAMDWASMLYRMYIRFIERKGWSYNVIEMSQGEEAGIKSATLEIRGTYAYGYLKGEAGTHRLVRQSPFNADSLRQTSFALVEVLPELEEVDLPEVQIKDDDLDIQFYRSGGHGGQNVNKVSTAVRLTHRPTGIVVTAQTERFQEANRKIAMTLLRSKIWVREQAIQEAKVKDLKGDYRPASWGNQIRSYVLHPYKMVKDLRTNVETGNTDAVLDGEIDDFIDAEIRML